MQSPITARIVAGTGIANLFSVLAAELSPSDLQSLLLAVYKTRVRGVHEADVLARRRRSALAAPSMKAPRKRVGLPEWWRSGFTKR